MMNFGKRGLALVLCLVCLLGVLPISARAVEMVQVYCVAPEDWTSCKAYWWGSSVWGKDWPGVDMTMGADGIWYTQVPSDLQGLIFNNGQGTQSKNLTLPDEALKIYRFEAGSWDGWEPDQLRYVVAGVGSLCGSDWNPSDWKNRMLDEDGDGIYTKTYENVASGQYELKVTTGSWDKSWGDPETGANYVLTVPQNDSTVTVGFDTQTEKIVIDINGSGIKPKPTVTLSGKITSFGDAKGTIAVSLDKQTLRLTNGQTDYAFEGLQPGSYTLTVSKEGHVTQTIPVALEADAVQNVTLSLFGDVNGDGGINVADVAMIYSHVRLGNILSGYGLECADFTQDKTVNIADTAAVYAYVRGASEPEKPRQEGLYIVGQDTLPYTDEELYNQLFDPNNKLEINLDMPDKELQKLQEDYERYRSFGSKSPIYRMGTLTITITNGDGTFSYQIDEVGARMKGNTSRTSFYNKDEGIYNYIHFKFDFQETFDDEEYYGSDCKTWASDELRDERKDRLFAGLEKLEMRWNKCYDRTYLKESYSYDFYRSEGVLAPYCNIGVLTWSGARMGIYTVQEPVDKIFIERRLPEEDWDGDLYKCGWTSEGASFTNTNSIGVEDEDKAAFYVYDLKTNKKKSTHAQLKNLINYLNSGSVTKEGFAQVVDVDNFLRFAAVSYFVGNPDDARNNYNNFYIYFRKSTGQVMFIPYDYDRCLGINREMNPSGHSLTRDNPFGEGNQKNPIYRYSVDNGGFYTKEFTNVLLEVAENDYLNPETFEDRYNTAVSLYADQVKPQRNLRNAEGRDFAFNINHTASASSGGNMSFKDYIEAKMSTFRGYMGQSDPNKAECYIRGSFNDWAVDSAYRMTKSGEVLTFTLTVRDQFEFKVFNQQDQTWMGAECLSADTTVYWETDGHSNVVLPGGSYRITYDPTNQMITVK